MLYPDNPLLGPLTRDEFIVANQPLVKTIAYRHFRAQCIASRTWMEDAVSEGTVGLINAYDRYNDASTAFISFAFPHIYGSIRNALSRRPMTGVRIPKWLYPLIKRINTAGLAEESSAVVARELGVTAKAARHALRCTRIATTEPLSETDREERGRPDDLTGQDAEAFIARLKPKQQRIVRLLMAEYTQTEVAQELGVTRQAIQGVMRVVRGKYEIFEKLSA